MKLIIPVILALITALATYFALIFAMQQLSLSGGQMVVPWFIFIVGVLTLFSAVIQGLSKEIVK